MANLGSVVVLLCSLAVAHAMEHTDMFMEKTGSEDLQTSASGYAYHINSGGPYRYASYNGDAPFHNFGDPPITAGRYSSGELPLHFTSYTSSQEYDPVYTGELINSYGTPTSYAQYAVPIKGYEDFDLETGIPEGTNYGLDSSNFLKGGGSNYEDAEKASHGEKGQSGYLNRREYAKGAKGQHENEQQTGYFGESGGNKAENQDVASHYANKAEASKANHGESFADKKGHNKGSKTTGYHKVHHKDEFKKDHSFYDESDKSGHFHKYGDYAGKQGAAQGAFKKGGLHNSGFKANDYGAKGFSDKGRFVDEASGFKGGNGKERYYKDGSSYGNKAGKEYGNVQGFSEGDKYGASV